MKVVTKISHLQVLLDQYRKCGKSIGFAPTMGALHTGHASLIEAAKEWDDITVCSIFVNPTQFNEASDLAKYPRTLSEDKKLLKKVGTDVLFVPSTDEIYPLGIDTKVSIDLGKMAMVMEGKFRPGHFEGMLQVVKRLLDIVQPDRLYMGQKDFQQFTIVQKMIESFDLPCQLMICPIIREKDGLAMSSRNVRLSTEFRKKAVILFKTLKWAKSKLKSMPLPDIKMQAMKRINATGLKVEYFDIVEGYTLKSIKTLKQDSYTAICTAAWAGDVRLIDNIVLNS